MDSCIQNFHLGRYIIGNLVLGRRASGAIKRNFRTYMKILNMIIPIIMHFCSLVSNRSLKIRTSPMKC